MSQYLVRYNLGRYFVLKIGTFPNSRAAVNYRNAHFRSTKVTKQRKFGMLVSVEKSRQTYYTFVSCFPNGDVSDLFAALGTFEC